MAQAMAAVSRLLVARTLALCGSVALVGAGGAMTMLLAEPYGVEWFTAAIGASVLLLAFAFWQMPRKPVIRAVLRMSERRARALLEILKPGPD